jgi:L-asparagine transporter-like permease
MIGMITIAVAIVIGQGLFIVVATSEVRAGPSVIVVNKFTGTARLCYLKGCKDLVSSEPFADLQGSDN